MTQLSFSWSVDLSAMTFLGSTMLVEVYREGRGGDTKAGQKAIERLRRVTKAMGRGPFMEEMLGGGSKEAHMMMMELPMMLDHFLHRFERRRLKGTSEIGNRPAADFQ